MHFLAHKLRLFWHSEDGATAVEYGLVAALVSVASIWALQNAGTELDRLFRSIAREINRALAGL